MENYGNLFREEFVNKIRNSTLKDRYGSNCSTDQHIQYYPERGSKTHSKQNQQTHDTTTVGDADRSMYHFQQENNRRRQRTSGDNCLYELPAVSHIKEHSLEIQQERMNPVDQNYQALQQRYQTRSISNGGDADRAFQNTKYKFKPIKDSNRQRNMDENSVKQLHCSPKLSTHSLRTNVNSSTMKYAFPKTENNDADHYSLLGNGSDESDQSQKSSSKTVVSRKTYDTSRLQRTPGGNCLFKLSAVSHINDHSLETQQNPEKMGQNYQAQKQRCQTRSISNGGDAERNIHYSNIQRNMDENSQKQLQSTPSLHTNVISSTEKYHTFPKAENKCADNCSLFHGDLHLGVIRNGSYESDQSQKSSSKRVVGQKSSHELRKMVTSHCKLQETIEKKIGEICNTKLDANADNNEPTSRQGPVTMSPCKLCSDSVDPRQSLKNVITEVNKEDFLDCRNSDTMTISINDVVNSKVINPMIRKLQRMYLNNLKEEMSLMEDLELVPSQVNEIYKATILKQKD